MQKTLTVLSRASFILTIVIGMLSAAHTAAQTFTFSTGGPDGNMAMASRPESPGKIEIEAADDFSLGQTVRLTSGSFTGLLPAGAPLSSITQVGVEIYRIFPLDSVNPPSGNVVSRLNSPSDVAFAARDTAAANLSFSATLLSGSFTAANSVLNGINRAPNQRTGGEGPVTGQEVRFNFTFTTPLELAADHYFFVPQVGLTSGDFFWLSSGTPTLPDLQTWTRNSNLEPDWSRVGTDIVGGVPAPRFNASFSLEGQSVPDGFSTLPMLGCSLALIGFVSRFRC